MTGTQTLAADALVLADPVNVQQELGLVDPANLTTGEEPDPRLDKQAGEFLWKVWNNDKKKINAGLYIYHVYDRNDKKVDSGKLVIIR